MEKKYDILYLLQHKQLPEYTKIGFTSRKDMKQRLTELNTASPTGIVLINEYKTPVGRAYQIEQALHKRYESYRSNGEWYSLNKKQIEDIDNWVTNVIKKHL